MTREIKTTLGIILKEEHDGSWHYYVNGIPVDYWEFTEKKGVLKIVIKTVKQ